MLNHWRDEREYMQPVIGMHVMVGRSDLATRREERKVGMVLRICLMNGLND